MVPRRVTRAQTRLNDAGQLSTDFHPASNVTTTTLPATSPPPSPASSGPGTPPVATSQALAFTTPVPEVPEPDVSAEAEAAESDRGLIDHVYAELSTRFDEPEYFYDAEAHARALRGRDATIAKLEREVRVLGNAQAEAEMFRLRANAAIGHIDAGRLERAKALLDADLDPAPRA